MATTDAMPVPKKNTAYRHYFAIRKNDGTLITTWAGQDSERSLDGAGFSDCTNEATEIGTTGIGYLELTAAEMNTSATVVKVTVTNTDALPYVVTLFPEEAGDIRTDVTQINGDATAASNLSTSAGTIVTGTVSYAVLNPATTTQLSSDDITEATADHFNGRVIIFTSGALQNQATDITDYELNGGEGRFTYTAITEAPADNDTFIII